MKHTSFLSGLSLFFLFVFLFFLREVLLSQSFFEAYEAKEYSQAQEDLEKKYIFGPTELYNLGNTQYFLSQKDPSQRRAYLESALKSYSGSLARREHPDTRTNYEYVKKLLQESSQEAQKDKQDEKKQQTNTPQENTGAESASGSRSESQNQDAQKMSEQQDSQTPMQNPRGEEYKLSQDQEMQALTEQEKEALNQYIEELNQEQQQNQGFFGKQVPQKTEFEKRFESLFGGSEEKDW